jgi:macrodomain Ter protein organizer (MatP/YcbG family)
MSKRKSLFEELNSLSLDKERLVEQKGEHIIAGAINLIEYIERTFDEDVASDLQKRLVNSIRAKDPRKFKRGIISAKKK